MAPSHFLNSKHNITLQFKKKNRMVLAFEKKQVNGTETYPMNKPTH